MVFWIVLEQPPSPEKALLFLFVLGDCRKVVEVLIHSREALMMLGFMMRL